MFGVASVFFMTRMVVKYLRYTSWGADDTWLVVGFVCLNYHYLQLPSVYTYVLTIIPDCEIGAYDSLNMSYPTK